MFVTSASIDQLVTERLDLDDDGSDGADAEIGLEIALIEVSKMTQIQVFYPNWAYLAQNFKWKHLI